MSHGRQEPTAVTGPGPQGLRNPKVISLAVLSLAFTSIFFELNKTTHLSWTDLCLGVRENGKGKNWEKVSLGEFAQLPMTQRGATSTVAGA